MLFIPISSAEPPRQGNTGKKKGPLTATCSHAVSEEMRSAISTRLLGERRAAPHYPGGYSFPGWVTVP